VAIDDFWLNNGTGRREVRYLGLASFIEVPLGWGDCPLQSTIEGTFRMSENETSKHMATPQQPMTSDRTEPQNELGWEIAKQLRALYSQQVSEPLPDKFINLLDQLAKSERKG